MALATLESDSLFPSNAQEQCWVWNNEGTEYFYDKHETVRIRIEQEHWHDQTPIAPSESESAANVERKSPYSITVNWLRDILRRLTDSMSLGLNDAVSAWSCGVVVRQRKRIICTGVA